MMKNQAKWASEYGRMTTTRLPDGCRGNAVPMAAQSKYDFRELGAYLGNVGLEREVFQHGGPVVGCFHHAWNVS